MDLQMTNEQKKYEVNTQMQEKNHTKKYLLPVAFVIILLVSLSLGVRYLRSQLMKLTIEERSNQLEEMVTQIQANLDSGLQTHWNLVEGLNNAVQGYHFENIQDVSDHIVHMENDFCTDLYGCRVMLLDEQGTAYLSDGPAGIWYDISHLLDEKNAIPLFLKPTRLMEAFWCFRRNWILPSRWERVMFALPISCC